MTAVAVIGGGPAGLMAAEAAAGCGVTVDLYDAMPSVGRKFLLAGRGGLNLTHSEPLDAFLARYGDARPFLTPMISAFPPTALRAWASGLGVETFVGTSGRVFPKEFKAAPLLRAWVRRLRELGVRFHPRTRWLGWEGADLLLQGADGTMLRSRPEATVLALGGASWPRLGSDGHWTGLLAELGVALSPLRPANCGFDIAWPDRLSRGFDGAPLKNVLLRLGERSVRGEVVLTATGIEGGAVYALSAALRDAIARDGSVELIIDLKADLDLAAVVERLARPRGAASLSTFLRKSLGLPPAAVQLLRGFLPASVLGEPHRLGEAVKGLALPLRAPRPIAEAISSAGGIALAELEPDLMLRSRPGLFAAGEMLDWEAPTGGYLLQACLSTGRWAGAAAAEYAIRVGPPRSY
jgi:uncharacterized flavoprotein (TIGR03862 family)